MNKEHNYQLDRKTHDALRGLIEDTVEYFCDEYRVSGEVAWLVVETLSTAKYHQIKGNIK